MLYIVAAARLPLLYADISDSRQARACFLTTARRYLRQLFVADKRTVPLEARSCPRKQPLHARAV